MEEKQIEYVELKTKVEVLHRFISEDPSQKYMDKNTIYKIFGWECLPEAYECNEN